MGASILQRILAARQGRVAAAMKTTSEAELRRRAELLEPARDFAAALGRAPYALVAEVKKGSPSRGILREGLNAAALAESYLAGGADALSVVVEPDYFYGDADWLAAIRQRVDCPLLQKDFFFSPYQVWEARALGADAILIILAMIGDDDAALLLATAGQAGLQVLVEVHDEAEAARAAGLGAKIVGVNNRDLATFEVRLETSLHLARKLPANALRVSESGIRSADDCRRLAAAGYGAFLIGEALVTAADPRAALKELR
jgi:indole-3-glycerol phosphate synthase